MPPALPLTLDLYNHHTDRHYETLVRGKFVERAQRLTRLARERGLGALRLSSDPLIEIGMEVDEHGRVTKNSLGVLDLSWQAARHPEWPSMVYDEVHAIRAGIQAAHGVPLENLIWVGMGGSSEDKAMYQALGLLDGGVRTYILDSTDPAKLEVILKGLARRDPLPRALRKTLVVGMAMGMTSYEPVVNLEKLDLLYRKHRIPSESNFLYMTLPGSLLDRFARPRGYRRVELQLDGENTTAGRHSGPLTRGSLYPLALNGVDLEGWIRAAVLSDDEIADALRMAAFLHGNGLELRDQVCLRLPPEWAGAGIWTKQDFEESLGKCEGLGIKIFPRAAPCPTPPFSAKDPEQRCLFWKIAVEGSSRLDLARLKALREAGYPLAVLKLAGPHVLAKYMQWIHYVVFGLGCLRQMNFVTQPSVELYKAITARLHKQARRAGALERTAAWRDLVSSPHRAPGPGGITLYYDSLLRTGLLTPGDLGSRRRAAEILARALILLRERKQIDYVELTFYGDTRYRPQGRRLREVLDTAGAAAFAGCNLFTDVYEGPAMNHSYHEMIIGHGRCFSIVMLSRKQTTLRSLDYRPDYHKAQWLATKLALEQRGRAVVALVIPDLTAAGRNAAAALFRQAARQLHPAPVLR